MPFGYDPTLQRFTCPECKKTWWFKSTDEFGRQFRLETMRKHFEQHYKEGPQQRLNSNFESYYREVLNSMKISVSQGATKSGLNFIKASEKLPNGNYRYRLGQTVDFTITGDVELGGSEKNPLYSVPVTATVDGTPAQGQYSLNKTALRILVSKLGDESEKWIGARFTSFVGPTRNPQTNEQTLGFTPLADSVKFAKSR